MGDRLRPRRRLRSPRRWSTATWPTPRAARAARPHLVECPSCRAPPRRGQLAGRTGSPPSAARRPRPGWWTGSCAAIHRERVGPVRLWGPARDGDRAVAGRPLGTCPASNGPLAPWCSGEAGDAGALDRAGGLGQGGAAGPARGRRVPPAGLRSADDDHPVPPDPACSRTGPKVCRDRAVDVGGACLAGLVAIAVLLAWADSTRVPARCSPRPARAGAARRVPAARRRSSSSRRLGRRASFTGLGRVVGGLYTFLVVPQRGWPPWSWSRWPRWSAVPDARPEGRRARSGPPASRSCWAAGGRREPCSGLAVTELLRTTFVLLTFAGRVLWVAAGFGRRVRRGGAGARVSGRWLARLASGRPRPCWRPSPACWC